MVRVFDLLKFTYLEKQPKTLSTCFLQGAYLKRLSSSTENKESCTKYLIFVFVDTSLILLIELLMKYPEYYA